MPIYEYQCQDCGEGLEALQKLSDAPLVDCPACGKPALKKKVSAVAFRLKGSGWYETDFKTGDNKKNLAGDAAAGGGDSASSKESAPSSQKKASDKGSGETKSTSKPAGDSAGSNGQKSA